MAVTIKFQANPAATKQLAETTARQKIRRFQLATEVHAVPRTPVDTGFLRAAYVSAPVVPMPGGFRSTISNNASYARFVFYGTKYMQARPVFQNAARMAARETGFAFRRT